MAIFLVHCGFSVAGEQEIWQCVSLTASNLQELSVLRYIVWLSWFCSTVWKAHNHDETTSIKSWWWNPLNVEGNQVQPFIKAILSKSLHISHTLSSFNETEFEIWAGFRPADSAECFWNFAEISYFGGGFSNIRGQIRYKSRVSVPCSRCTIRLIKANVIKK